MSNVSKAIAGAVAGIIVMWVNNLWGIETPADTVTWFEGVIDTVIGGIIGYILVWLAPKNTPS